MFTPRLPKFADPFLLTLLLTVGLASVAPVRGNAAQGVGIAATATVMLLFFLHGARLAREHLLTALGHWRLHATILAITFVAFPLLGLLLMHAGAGMLPGDVWTGVLFLCALPSTVQSSIAFTSIARGNVAGAIASAAASNMLGIFLTPIIVGLLTRVHGGELSWSGVWAIAWELLLPFALGQALRPWIGAWVTRHKTLLFYSDRSTILLSVYSAFSAAVVDGIWGQVRAPQLAALVVVCAVLLAAVLVLSHTVARRLGFSPEDEIAILFCGSKKSLVSGVPMARVLFAGPSVGSVVLPIMIFHQLQLMVCAWLARRYSGRQAA